MTCTQWLALAEAQRSLPVWPVPVWYVLAGLAGWIVAECWLKRAASSPGLLAGGLLTFYGVLRLAFDGFIEASSRTGGLTSAQYASLLAVAVGLGMIVIVRRRKKGDDGHVLDSAPRRVAGVLGRRVFRLPARGPEAKRRQLEADLEHVIPI